METKVFPFEIKDTNDSTGEFKGKASVFGNVDAYRDIIHAGAFTKTLKYYGGEVPILWQHLTNEPIGQGKVFETDRWLEINPGVIAKSVPRGAEAYSLMRPLRPEFKRPPVSGLSIGYVPTKVEYENRDDGPIRHINELKLYEVSVVTIGANDKALITGVKSRLQDDRLNRLITDVKKIAEALALKGILDDFDFDDALSQEDRHDFNSLQPKGIEIPSSHGSDLNESDQLYELSQALDQIRISSELKELRSHGTQGTQRADQANI